MSEIKGEKYIYLAMAYRLAKENGGNVKIGDDNGFVGGQNYARHFRISDYDGKKILAETKFSSCNADFTRYFEVSDRMQRPYIYEYFNEYGDNMSNRWDH